MENIKQAIKDIEARRDRLETAMAYVQSVMEAAHLDTTSSIDSLRKAFDSIIKGGELTIEELEKRLVVTKE